MGQKIYIRILILLELHTLLHIPQINSLQVHLQVPV